MTAPTTTAATPAEELATITVRYRLPKSEAQAMMLDERARQVSWDDVFAERDAQRAEIERLTKELAREEAACGDVIDQRDAAEKALSDLFSMVTGRPPEWSNLFGYSEALDECDDALSASQERERVMREALNGAKNCMELALRHTDHGGIIHAMNEGVGLIDAALSAKEATDER